MILVPTFVNFDRILSSPGLLYPPSFLPSPSLTHSLTHSLLPSLPPSLPPSVGQGSVPRNGLATGSTQASQVLPPSSTSNSHLSPPPSLNSPSPQHHPPLSSSSSSSLAGGGCGLGGATTPSSTNSVVQSSTLTCGECVCMYVRTYVYVCVLIIDLVCDVCSCCVRDQR